MSAFDDMLARDAAIFTDPSLSAEVESVEYHGYGETTPMTVPAQIFRASPMTIPGAEGLLVPAMQIFICRSADATKGRSKVTASADWIKVATNRGGDAVKHTVDVIVSEDGGGFMLRMS